MKKIIALLILITSTFASAQSFDFQYDHYSVIVKDLDKVGAFYKDVLNLKEIPHPSAPSGFKWFVIKGNSQLHLLLVFQWELRRSRHSCLIWRRNILLYFPGIRLFLPKEYS
jgi:catechol 2,3-dioxygenase-like lactoylglutathione lyase family enzyme